MGTGFAIVYSVVPVLCGVTPIDWNVSQRLIIARHRKLPAVWLHLNDGCSLKHAIAFSTVRRAGLIGWYSPLNDQGFLMDMFKKVMRKALR